MKLATAIENCTQCPDLVANRQNVVIGDGPIPCDLVFLGEGPGKLEDDQGIPFVGTSGKHLRTVAHLMKLKESQFHILNLVKCRPPDNRDPTPEEIKNCEKFFYHQLNSVRPKVILALGRYAQAFALNKNPKKIKVIANAGKVVTIDDRNAKLPRDMISVLTYHPAFVLRHRNQEIDKAFRKHVKIAKRLAYDM